MHFRHCVSTVSPPGASLPPGVDLPHVAAPAGSDGVPPEEGCYSCNVNSNGIPLQHPRERPQYLRVKRSADDDFTEQEVRQIFRIYSKSMI